jgi:hypothetical protein
MGRVLADGGFPVEALAPVREAVELCVRALAVQAGNDAAGQSPDPLPAAAIHKELVGADRLDAADAAQISTLRELSGGDGGGIDEATARRLIDAAQKFLEKVHAALARHALRA